MRRAMTPMFPRLLGSVLITATLTVQTLPAGAQPAATNPPPPATGKAPDLATPKSAPATTAPATPGASAPAPEAPPMDEKAAKQALADGQEAYRQGDYATAARLFAQANQAAPSPEAQYWLAMSLDLQGRTAEAIEAFGTLFSNPRHTELDAELLDPARQRFELLQKIPATVLLQITPADAQVEVDGAVQLGTAPFTLKLTAGKHVLRVTREGFQPLETELEVKPAQSLEQSLELTAEPEPAAAPAAPAPVEAEPAPPPPVEPRSMVPAYVTLGVAGASAALGTIFGLQALSAKSDFDDNPNAGNADDVERNALIADMAWGIALTLGITGVVLLTSDEPAPQQTGADDSKRVAKSQLRVAPYVSPTSAGAAAGITF